MKTSKAILLSVVIFTAIFVISGYLLSNAFFFKQLIHSNQITTPEQAFRYVNNNTYFAGDFKPYPEIIAGLTPKYMLTERKRLWCDESAIVLATMVQQLGFETRLVDIIGDDNQAHHTYLEVLENGKWKTYDTVKRKEGLTNDRLLMEWGWFEKGSSRPRTFPKWYNRILQNNFYLQYLSLKLRGIPS